MVASVAGCGLVGAKLSVSKANKTPVVTSPSYAAKETCPPVGAVVAASGLPVASVARLNLGQGKTDCRYGANRGRGLSIIYARNPGIARVKAYSDRTGANLKSLRRDNLRGLGDAAFSVSGTDITDRTHPFTYSSMNLTQGPVWISITAPVPLNRVIALAGLILQSPATTSVGGSTPKSTSTSIVPALTLRTIFPQPGDLGVLGVGAGWGVSANASRRRAVGGCEGTRGDRAIWLEDFTGSDAGGTKVRFQIQQKASAAAASAEVAEHRGPTFQACFRALDVQNAEASAGADPTTATWHTITPAAGGVAYAFTMMVGSCTSRHDDYFVARGSYLVFVDYQTCAPIPQAAERQLVDQMSTRVPA